MIRWLGFLAFACSIIQPALAQDFPVKTVRIVVGFPPGGGADFTARMISPRLNEAWGRPVIVDNRPGAAGNLAADLVAKAPADGYTVLVMPGPSAPILNPNLPFDMRKDFAPITHAARGPNVVVVHPSVPASNVKELIALARSRAGKLNYASSGIGLTPHLSAELLRQMAKIDIVHVPYKGAGPAVADLMGGHVDMMSVSIPAVLGQIKVGRLRAIGVTSLERSPMLPEIPTLDATGVKGYALYGWWGLLAPAGTPSDIIARHNAAMVKALNMPDVRKRFADEGTEVVANTPAQWGDFFQKEMNKWDAVIAAAQAAR